MLPQFHQAHIFYFILLFIGEQAKTLPQRQLRDCP